LVGEIFGPFFRGPKPLLKIRAFVAAEGRGAERDEFLILLPRVGGTSDRGASEDDDEVGFWGFHGWMIDGRRESRREVTLRQKLVRR
jgi:hypothetical protein